VRTEADAGRLSIVEIRRRWLSGDWLWGQLVERSADAGFGADLDGHAGQSLTELDRP
jgi:hypothetical protein